MYREIVFPFLCVEWGWIKSMDVYRFLVGSALTLAKESGCLPAGEVLESSCQSSFRIHFYSELYFTA